VRSISLGIEASQDVLGEAGERTVWAEEEEEEEE
jgi:hypothetical protein